MLGPKTATGARHDHFRVWRKRRLRQLEKQYGDRLDEVADWLAEFAAALRCSKWCVYDLINTGALKSIRLGRAIRVTRRALEEFLAV